MHNLFVECSPLQIPVAEAGCSAGEAGYPAHPHLLLYLYETGVSVDSFS